MQEGYPLDIFVTNGWPRYMPFILKLVDISISSSLGFFDLVVVLHIAALDNPTSSLTQD